MITTSEISVMTITWLHACNFKGIHSRY